MAWFELAGHRFENPDIVFAIDRQGPLGDPYVDGNIGVEFLKPFRMVLDFANRRVAFLPRFKDKVPIQRTNLDPCSWYQDRGRPLGLLRGHRPGVGLASSRGPSRVATAIDRQESNVRVRQAISAPFARLEHSKNASD